MNNKNIFITGGASGIGKECAKLLLQNGAKNVFIGDCNIETGKRCEQELCSKYGNRVKFYKCDVTNVTEFENVFKSCQIDIFLNNAGTLNGPKTIDVNLVGVLNGLNIAFKYMHSGGIVINTASILGLTAYNELTEYTATKHGVIGLTKSFSYPKTYERTGIKVLAVCPGVTETPLIDSCGSEKSQKQVESDLFQNTPQGTEIVAKCILQMIQTGDNGSFWVVEDNEIYEIEIPHYSNLRKQKKN